jgi:hypothetical protein
VQNKEYSILIMYNKLKLTIFCMKQVGLFFFSFFNCTYLPIESRLSSKRTMLLVHILIQFLKNISYLA